MKIAAEIYNIMPLDAYFNNQFAKSHTNKITDRNFLSSQHCDKL